jgi:hypothetical protein
VFALLPPPAPTPSPNRAPSTNVSAEPRKDRPPSRTAFSPSHSSSSATSRSLLQRFDSSLPHAAVRHPSLRGRPTYGQPLDFRGLRHEPVNEQGVVLLFGLVAKELGSSSNPSNPVSPTAKPSARSPRIAGNAFTSNLNSRAAISATTATLPPAATSSSAGATTGPNAPPPSKSSNSPP